VTPAVRPYEARDRDALNAVARAAFAQYRNDYDDWPAFIDGIGRMADLTALGDLLVAECGDTVTGGVLHVAPGRPRSPIFPAEWSVIRMLVVAPEARGQGIARRLLAACLRCAVEAGAPGVALHTSPVMATALRMYEAIGFVRDRDIPPIQGMAYGRYMLPAAQVARALALLDATAGGAAG
jgi:GNAT superfamily N-acetyltransferase